MPQHFPNLRAANLDVNLRLCAREPSSSLFQVGALVSPAPLDNGVHALFNITADEILAAPARDDGGPPWPQHLLLALA